MILINAVIGNVGKKNNFDTIFDIDLDKSFFWNRKYNNALDEKKPRSSCFIDINGNIDNDNDDTNDDVSPPPLWGLYGLLILFFIFMLY